MEKAEILGPAGNLSSLKAAVDAGADVVYLGFNDSTNARNFEGLNFTEDDLREGIEYLRGKGKKFYLAINTFPQASNFKDWENSVDKAVTLGADALILANTGVLKYASEKYPTTRLHLSVQASASNYEAINFYKKHFNIKRVILPRVLTTGEIRTISENTDVELEAFILGGLCINIEGRCYLSSYVTGASTNTEGACSPSRFVDFSPTDGGGMTISLNKITLNRLSAGEKSPYPTCCKGRYLTSDGELSYAMEEPESLNALSLIPDLIEAGVSALKIEGRQRTKSYVGTVTGILREAVDSYYVNPASFAVKKEWTEKTRETFEGTSSTLGSYAGK
ncbi:MAG: U32 family peptidase [Deltaproteobacteria bacterium]|nr:U32 family peptidase [Deltaproteobacteria bacterium]